MKHKTLNTKLLLYLENLLSEKDRRKVEEHLSEHPELRDKLSKFEVIWNDKRKDFTAPDFLWFKVANKIHTAKFGSRKIHHSYQIAYRYFVLTGLVILTLLIGSRFGYELSSQNKSLKQKTKVENISSFLSIDKIDPLSDESINKFFIPNNQDEGVKK